MVIPYTGYDSNGSSFRGRITIRVSQAQNTGDLTYTIAQGGKVTFDDDDFNDLSKAVTGYPWITCSLSGRIPPKGRFTTTTPAMAAMTAR
ncbi:hypothetical protein M5E87_02050 [Flavonifractor plautii]|nr:hypothetical protein M5E87_02050 [Flavonifractor plautii]